MLVCQPSVYGLAGFPPQALATHQFLSAFGNCLPSNLLHRVDDALGSCDVDNDHNRRVIVGQQHFSAHFFYEELSAFKACQTGFDAVSYIQVLSLVPILVIR